MATELDDDGYLVMTGFSDEDPPATDPVGSIVFPDPPPLSDSDWLAAVAAAVTASPEDVVVPVDGGTPTEDGPAGHPGPDGVAAAPWPDEPDAVADHIGWLPPDAGGGSADDLE